MHSILRTPLVLVLAATVVCACSTDTKPADRPVTPADAPAAEPVIHVSEQKLAGGAETPEGLIDSAFAALQRRDEDALARLMITRDEFDRIIYPEYALHYPIAKDPRPEVKKLVGYLHFQSAAKSLRRLVANFGGHRFTWDSVAWRDGIKQFRSYQIREGTVVFARDDEGQSAEFTAFGSIIRRDGRCKFMSYLDHD